MGLAVAVLGAVGLAALLSLAKQAQTEFAPKRLMATQEPILLSTVKAAREATSELAPSELVLGVTVGAESRAYPINMLAGPHENSQISQEIINDQLGGEAIVVTWCELCHSGRAYARTVEGQELTFGAAGQLWKENLVLYDRETGTLWSQFLGEGEQGPLQGKKLRPLPTVKTDWRSWFAQYPDSTVAELPRKSERYRTEAYAQIRVELVLGITAGPTAKAWKLQRLQREPLQNDEFDGKPVLVLYEPRSHTARLYARTVGDKVLTFHLRQGKIVDDETQSTWEWLSGRAVVGPLAGKVLTALPATVSHQSSWLAFYPPSTLVP
jgi:hypothetical protein